MVGIGCFLPSKHQSSSSILLPLLFPSLLSFLLFVFHLTHTCIHQWFSAVGIYLPCLFPLSSPPVPAVAGLLCSLLVSLLHTGGHTGPPGPQGPSLPAQETWESPGQAGAPRERSGGRGWRGGGGRGGRGARLRGGVACGAGLREQSGTFKWGAADNIALSQMMSLKPLTVCAHGTSQAFTLPSPPLPTYPPTQPPFICGGGGSQCGLQMDFTEERTLCLCLHSLNAWPCMKICVCAVTVCVRACVHVCVRACVFLYTCPSNKCPHKERKTA